MTASDFPQLSPADWPEDIADLRNSFAGQLGVYRLVARHPPLLRSWVDFRNHIVLNSAVGPVLSELVILRVAAHFASEYTWSHHVVRARAVGLIDRRIRAMRGPLADIIAIDRDLIGAVDDLLDAGQIQAGHRSAVYDLLGEAALFDLIATVAMYSMIAGFANTFELPVDPDIEHLLQLDPSP